MGVAPRPGGRMGELAWRTHVKRVLTARSARAEPGSGSRHIVSSRMVGADVNARA